MASLQQQSPTKFAPVDWHTSNLLMSSSADRQRSISHDIRQQSHTTRDVTNNKTRWTQHGTDSELTHRIKDIGDWKQSLSITLKNVETEINKLSEHKQLVEKALEAKNIPLEVVLGCLSAREHRVAIDLVRDEVEMELNKELEVIEGIRTALHLKINSAFKQLCVLQECHKQLCDDLDDKDTALGIDGTCADLSNQASTISYQGDPTRIKRGIVTPHQWSSFSAHNTVNSETEMQNSVRLRELMSQTVRQTTADLEAQWTATHYAFRKRKHEVEQVKKELEWQQKSTEKEIADMMSEIDNLEMSLAAKVPPMMVVHTRLENRTQRPNIELCRDQPQYDMVEEIAEISESVQALKDKLAMARETLGILERTLMRIKEDIQVKTNSLDLDEQCMQMRQKLSEHPQLL